MGAWRMVGAAAALAALLCATRASGGTVAEPIARLYLEGGYDSNPLHDGTASARSARLSPDVGLRLRAPRWDLRGTYGGELVYLDWASSDRMWNHRGGLALDARPTRRTALAGGVHVSQAVDPSGLARVGVFRGGRHRALVVNGRGRLEWRAERDLALAATFHEQTVLFDDGTGGAMHGPGVEALWRRARRVWLGAAYGLGVFQSFERAPAADLTAYAHALRARARWQATRHVSLNAWAGAALWVPGGGSSVVPEAFAELLFATRGADLRVNVGHGLGIGATARPGVVDAVELGAERRFGRTWFARGSGGMWRSGTAPRGRDGVTGYAIGGEAGVRLENDLRLSVTAARYGRVEESSGDLGRTTVGVRLGWELPARRR
jgi:hypothetical protein